MLTYQNETIKTSVRRLVEFLLRSGDINRGAGLVQDPEAMLAGSRLHRKIQRAQKATYQSEVSLKKVWKEEGYTLCLEGRADGIERVEKKQVMLMIQEQEKEKKNIMYPEEKMKKKKETATAEGKSTASDQKGMETEETIVVIDEIKCVYRTVEEMLEADPLHLAQAKCYAYLYGSEKNLKEVAVQITYCNLETEKIRRILQVIPMDELSPWFLSLKEQYKMWADYYVAVRKERNESIQKMHFPFDFREGQKTMTAMVYRAVEEQKHIFLQAPTGVGKTISTIYPSLKSMGEEKAERIFYLTAKTITRTVAEDTLKILRKQKLCLKTVTITARDKICVMDAAECTPFFCERAKGHYDRINEALYALLRGAEAFTRENLLRFSEQYQVCPYELSFEAASWCDMIICDYNYVFDPHVNRKSLFGEANGRKNIFLIDEAHNLLDRAREMYSAVLCKKDFLELKKYFQGKSRFFVKKVQNCLHAFAKIERAWAEEQGKQEESYGLLKDVDVLYFPLFRLGGYLEEYLKEHDQLENREKVVPLYFQLRHFLMILENMTQGYQIYGWRQEDTFFVRLFCVDPSEPLEEYWEKSRSSIFFSATMLPIRYYKQLLSGSAGTQAFGIPSPFQKEKRLLMITEDVTSRYQKRGEYEYQKMVRYLELTVEAQKGNYIIFFPSYKMLAQVEAIARQSTLDLVVDFAVQRPSMEEEEREKFLLCFQEKREKPLLGFCVLGSIFSEGIDLVGKRLSGVLIVGTGLPQVCREREIIRSYFDSHQKKGYDYAYRYPGMNKALQAAGRVIRSGEDVGLIVLMDDRFLQRENQLLLPEEWDSYYQVSLQIYEKVLQRFWESVREENSESSGTKTRKENRRYRDNSEI